MARTESLAAVISPEDCMNADPSRSAEDCVIPLFNGASSLAGLYPWFSDSGFSDPRGVFSVADGLLRVSGNGLGALISMSEYRDFRMLLEFRWGDEVYSPRVGKARDAGVFLHSRGVEGGYKGSWLPGIQSQVMEGSMGDLILMKGNDAQGSLLPMSMTVPVNQVTCTYSTWNCRGGYVWDADGAPRLFDRVTDQVHWYGWDPDWRDRAGFRGDTDFESPNGGWNQMVLVADGDQLDVYFNGIRINAARDVYPTEGKVQLEVEYAEYFVRRWELWPLSDPRAPRWPVSIMTQTLPEGIVGASYTGFQQTAGGTGTATWTVTAGRLPPGLSIHPATGAVTGQPTAQGSFSFDLKVADANGSVDVRSLSIIIGQSGGGTNQPPIARDDSGVVAPGDSVVINVLGNDTDDRGLDPASVDITLAPTAGSVFVDPVSGAITYTQREWQRTARFASLPRDGLRQRMVQYSDCLDCC